MSAVAFSLSGCDAVLDRPDMVNPVDNNYWRNETDFRLYANDGYPLYFVGYNSGWGTDYAPLRGYNFSDDQATAGKQSSFENTVPDSRGGTSMGYSSVWLSQYNSANWNFTWVRKWNIMLERLDEYRGNLSDEAYLHWTAVARFFRGVEYARMVATFGDVPYFEHSFGENDKDEMFKDRTPRAEVMDHVYDDFQYAMTNLRLDDGAQYLNRYIAAGFISRYMLFEGTWQKYHNNNSELATKYLQQAIDAANMVIGAGQWSITSDFRSLFGSMDLSGNPEVLMYRHYDAGKGVTHHVASYCNGNESQTPACNLALAQAFICNDGKVYQNSDVANADDFTIENMVVTRDPRFEATFWNMPIVQSATLLYCWKFIDRTGPTYRLSTPPAQYASMTNTNDYPVMRYSEVLLNWIEAKAELATLGGTAVTQGDIDLSINAIRNRPLDAEAEDKGVQKTAPMMLSDITASFDPARDADVDPLIWEIRRERRMEFVFEHSRLLDIKRWKKLDYMDNTKHPETMYGLWIDINNDLPSILSEGTTAVAKPNGDGTYTKVVYDGTNADQMVGFYIPNSAVERDPFTDRSYLSPVGRAQINQYVDQGYKLTQTPGWEE